MLRYPSPLLMVVILLQPLANALFSQAPDQTKGKTLSLTYDFKEAGKAMKILALHTHQLRQRGKIAADCCSTRPGE